MRTIFAAVIFLGIGLWLGRRGRREEPEKETSLAWTLRVGDDAFSIEGVMSMIIKLRVGQSVDVLLKPTTAKGTAAQVQEGSVVWEVADNEVATVTENPTDQLAARIKALTEGETVLTFHGDADPGSGVREVLGVASIVVTDLAAVFEFSAGEPFETVDETSAGGPPSTGDTGTEIGGAPATEIGGATATGDETTGAGATAAPAEPVDATGNVVEDDAATADESDADSGA